MGEIACRVVVSSNLLALCYTFWCAKIIVKRGGRLEEIILNLKRSFKDYLGFLTMFGVKHQDKKHRKYEIL
jgi:hypothetical protein